MVSSQFYKPLNLEKIIFQKCLKFDDFQSSMLLGYILYYDGIAYVILWNLLLSLCIVA